MPRQFLITTVHKDAVQAAARAFGAQAHVRSFTRSDLERLKTPFLVVMDSGRVADLNPEMLQTLRRTNRGGMRYSPFIVFCDRGAEMEAWRAAGALPLSSKSDRAAIKKAIQEAIESARIWVTSATYVGPCRRRHKAVLQWRNRRSADADEVAAKEREKAKKSGAEERVFSIDVLVRRLNLSATLLSGSTIESRRAFRDLVNDLQASAQAHHRGDLTGIINALKREADLFIQDGQRDGAVLQRLVTDLRVAAERGA